MANKTYIGVGRTTEGAYFWWLTTSTGRQIFNSEKFETKEACERAIKQMKRELFTAPVMDITAHDTFRKQRKQRKQSKHGLRLVA
ncbi:MAG: DUF1508 domain-containing protein [Rubricoccaceae bacterium]|nr:DUF1508 domain-containing protein [Rubricoccaceae bacterium]